MIDWTTEWPKIQAIAIEYGVDPLFIAAIRHSENGDPGREFGVLSVAAPTYEAQCHVCCATVRNHLTVVVQPSTNYLGLLPGPSVRRVVYSDTWVRAFANQWAPSDATNDPKGLNKNWYSNTRTAYIVFVADGHPSDRAARALS